MRSPYNEITPIEIIEQNKINSKIPGKVIITPAGVTNEFPGICNMQFYKAGESDPVYYSHTNLCSAFIMAREVFGKGKMVQLMASIGTFKTGPNITDKHYNGNLAVISFITTTHNKEKASYFVVLELMKLAVMHPEIMDALDVIGLNPLEPVMIDVIEMGTSECLHKNIGYLY